MSAAAEALLTLRLLTPDDTAAYRALWIIALTEQAEFFRIAVSDAQALAIPTHFAADSFTLGAFRGGELIGIASLERDSREKLRHKALLFRMFVHPLRAGAGVGKQLLREAIRLAESLGDLRQIYLTVLAANERAQRLYASVGFRGYSREPNAVRIGDRYVDELQMVRFLRKEEWT